MKYLFLSLVLFLFQSTTKIKNILIDRCIDKKDASNLESDSLTLETNKNANESKIKFDKKSHLLSKRIKSDSSYRNIKISVKNVNKNFEKNKIVLIDSTDNKALKDNFVTTKDRFYKNYGTLHFKKELKERFFANNNSNNQNNVPSLNDCKASKNDIAGINNKKNFYMTNKYNNFSIRRKDQKESNRDKTEKYFDDIKMQLYCLNENIDSVFKHSLNNNTKSNKNNKHIHYLNTPKHKKSNQATVNERFRIDEKIIEFTPLNIKENLTILKRDSEFKFKIRFDNNLQINKRFYCDIITAQFCEIIPALDNNKIKLKSSIYQLQFLVPELFPFICLINYSLDSYCCSDNLCSQETLYQSFPKYKYVY